MPQTLDVQTRLNQWLEEVNNPNHPNHYHASLQEPADRYPRIIELVEKLRTTPDDFDKHDMVALFGLLNSGQRTKERLVQHNELPELRRSLLRLLDQSGDASQKIARASDEIRYAGSRMLGELYGWRFAETTPLYNQCAIDALHHLGYRFNPKDYDAFVQAHEQFKAVYVATIGRQRTDIPLNLEVDKFYNVLHKVDLKTSDTPLAEPFSNWVNSREEMDWALDMLKEVLDALGAKGPDDKRIALTTPRGRYLLRLNFGNSWMWDLCGPNNDYISYKGQTGITWRVDRTLTDLHERYESWGNDPFPMVSLPMVEAKRVEEETRQARLAAYQHFAQRFRNWRGGPFRPHHQHELFEAIYDRTKRNTLYTLGVVPPPVLSPHPEAPFITEAFDLLSELHLNPRKTFYDQHKQAFQSLIEDPFKELLSTVASLLPDAVTEVMETRKRIVARFTKNDYGQGGAWDFYWGAFYSKGSKRSQGAQLLVAVVRQLLECGFSIGDYGSEQRERFQRNCEQYAEMLTPIMEQRVMDELLFFGPRESLLIGPDGMVEQAPDETATWHDFLENPTAFTCKVSVIIPKQELLLLSQEELANRIAAVHATLFPLVLLACYEEPIPAIEHYLGLAPADEGDDLPLALPVQPEYPLPTLVEETGFDRSLVERWLRALERKQQVIFYGPPGTGKTFIAERLAKHLVGGGDGLVDLVQFHPAYAYEDFIQGIRPDVKSGQLSYDMAPGRFLEFCRKAAERTGKCVLIIDEINRANLARVFGELMYLLEYRDSAIPLAGGGSLSIPNNVYILGTMNTADRSIALVDHALRRRFAFLELQPDYNLLRHYHEREKTGFPVDGLIATLVKLNSAIRDPHYFIGISFFMRADLAEQIEDIWCMEILPYVKEYFFNQPDKVNEFSWDRVRSKVSHESADYPGIN